MHENSLATPGERSGSTGGGGDAAEADRLARALTAFVRAEFEAPVGAVNGLIDLLHEDAARGQAHSYIADLGKMRIAGARLQEMVSHLIDVERNGQALSDQDPESFSGKLRHDLRTPLTALLGYSELLAEEAREDGQDAILGTLSSVTEAGQRLLGQIDAMVDFMRASDGVLAHPDSAAEPAAALVQHALETIRPVLLEEQHAASPTATGRILVVDDNVSNLDLLSRRLTREGHDITTAPDGQGALDLFRHREFDVVLLDLMMPGISGIEVLRRLRADPRTAEMPVIMISALDEVDSAVRCIEAGANDYLSKPLNPTLLRARINAVLDRKLLRDRDRAITQQLRAEQQRSESLLRNLLPETIIDRLNQGESVIADHFECATILFCDLVGFTPLSSSLTPQATLELLNGIFSGFDRLAARHRLEKIKTIGDGYMVAGGLPKTRPDHAQSVADMALGMGKVVDEMSRAVGRTLGIRIGIHTGPVVAGIIGTHKFVYDVWGDTVNIASRMEHHGAPGRIHVSAATRTALGDGYRFDDRAPMEIKGKGVMQTHFLESRAWDHAAWPPLMDVGL